MKVEKSKRKEDLENKVKINDVIGDLV